MALSRREFAEGLYSECLEEAAFLYQQRAYLRAEGSLTRHELGRLERRMEAFLEAAALGRDTIAELCMKRSAEGDPEDGYVTARILVRLGRVESLAEVLGQVDVGDEKRVAALRDGLCHQLPHGVLPQPSHLPAETCPEVSAMLVTALGHGRRAEDWVLPWTEQMLGLGQDACVVEAARYLGRVKRIEAVGLLRRCLDSPDAAVKLSAAQALLRLGDLEAPRALLDSRSFPAWACTLMGVAGGRDAVRRLFSLLESGEAGEGARLALGALGDPAAVPVLIAQLSDARHAEEAALALQLLTGAVLWDESVEREALDEAELFSNEEGTGESATLVRIPSRNAADWSRWWEEHRSRFSSAPRWRVGRPFSPSVLVEMLSAETPNRVFQQLACDELAIRYGVDWGFEPDALQSLQEPALRNGRRWLEENQQRFTEGRWYRAGRPL